ncbi:MAG TPA: amino acid adenylation domain-containing protein, partial [Amycolatopsis sp.]|uniref:non-ribosomal peptide synthetase n=1 Tax=Amycolatopsis sp. TaxID=37632 RepID=UPI002B4A7F61
MAEQDRGLPLSAAQYDIWLAQRIGGPSAVYNCGEYMEIGGALDVPLFETALRRAVEETPSLNVRLVERPDGPYQIVAPAEWSLEVTDLRAEADPAAVAAERMRQDLSVPADPVNRPLFAHALWRVADAGYLWYQRYNHVVMDAYGWSIFGRRVAEIYTALVRDSPYQPARSGTVGQLLAEQRGYRASADYETDRDYWVGRFADRPEPVNLTSSGAAGGRATGGLAGPSARGLGAAAPGLTWPNVVVATAAAYFSRLTGRREVVFSVVLTGRVSALAGRTPATMANIVPVRIRVDPREDIVTLARRVRDELGEAARHQRFRGEELRRQLDWPPGRRQFGPLVNVVTFDRDLDFAGVTASRHDLSVPPVEDLMITVRGRPDSGRIQVDVDGVSGPDCDLSAHHRAFLNLLEAVVATPRRAVGRLDTLAGADRRQVVETWNDTSWPVADASLPSLFAAQVGRTPDDVAVVDETGSLTYAELDARSNQVARWLRDRGAGPGSRVAILLPRSLDLVAVLWGVCKSGAAYVPVDPDYPAARIAYVLEDAAPAVVVTPELWQRTELAAVSAAPLDLVVVPGLPAYVIYTSGSTGRPKGVVVSHRSIVNRLLWMRHIYRLTGADRVLHKTPTGFDVSVWELFWPLLAGAALVLARPGGHRDPAYLVAASKRFGVTVAHFVPAMLAAFVREVEPGERLGLRQVVCSGEALPPGLVAEFRERVGVPLANLYGPTEAAVDVTYWDCPADGDPAVVPIGRPVWNTGVFVLDESLRPVGPGITGELYLTGVQLALGYAGSAALTAGRFVASPFASGCRMYRTGDRAYWSAEGQLCYAGRSDDQVKIRGFRIEPGEVEAALSAHESVVRAVVLAREDQPGARRLVGYVVPAAGRAVDSLALLDFVARTLPEHLVPAAVVVLDALPVTANGKLDRAALPAPEFGGEGRAPSGPLEEAVGEQFAEVLGLAGVGAEERFFALGGDSLLAVRLIARIRSALDAEITLGEFFAEPTVAGLARAVVRARGGVLRDRMTAVPRPPLLPLSFGQQRMWVLNQLAEAGLGAAYQIPIVLRLTGEPDVSALAAAFRDVAGRHQILRTVFPKDDAGLPRQLVLDGPAGEPELRTSPAGALDLTTGFDLAAELPWRLELRRESASAHLLVVLAHHIAMDGWSKGVLARDLATAYAARRDGRAPRWAPPPVQYADYAIWQREMLGEPDDPDSVLSRQLAHWRDVLAGLPDQLDLPADRNRPAVSSFRGAAVPFAIEPRVHAGLLDVAEHGNATLFMVVQAALAVLLTRLGAGTDVPIGTAVAGRTDDALDDLVGFFVNTLVLRTDVSGDPSFAELVARVRETDLAAYTHQDVPFERLVDELNPPRSLSRHPLFQVMLVLQNTPPAGWELPGLTVTELDETELGDIAAPARFDLSVTLTEHRGPGRAPAGIEGSVRYAVDLFERPTATRLADRLRRVLEQVAKDPDRPVSRYDVLLEDEAGGQEDTEPVAVATFPELFAAQVARTPDAIALDGGDAVLTYAELDRRTDQVAGQLAARGIGPEDRVGVLLERGPELIVVLLGVLKAGATYLPIDPAHPAARIGFVLADAGPALVVCSARTGRLLPDGPDQVRPETLRQGTAAWSAPVLRPAHPAYLIYTSGSTGTPKGVLVSHKGFASMAAEQVDRFGGGPGTRVLQFASASFDASIAELVLAVLSGATLVVPPAEEMPPFRPVEDVLAEHRITHVTLPPSVLAGIPALPSCLTSLVVAGEACPPALAGRWGEKLSLVNAYGPTESTVCATQSAPLRPDPSRTAVPIGVPARDTRVHLLDEFLRPVAPGVVGEIYLSGPGLARGYAGRAALTAERFVACPFRADRMYRTGDLARRTSGGQLVFAGRGDDQVKIRGFRIEPAEIEAAVTACEGVARAAVIAREEQPGTQRLACYVVAERAPLDVAALREAVAARLPGYLVPAAFVVLDDLPVTVNGKLDRDALPAPVSGVSGRAPATPAEELVCGLFGEVLGLERVRADSSFFDLGGDSLLAMRLVVRVRAVLDVEITVRDLFEAPSPAGLARAAHRLRGTPARAALTARKRPDVLPLSSGQLRMWFLNGLAAAGAGAAYNAPLAIRLTGRLDRDALRAALGDLADRHEILRTVFPDSDGHPRQHIRRGADGHPELTVREITEAELPGVLEAAARTGFDLTAGLPWRTELLVLSADECVLLLVAHHIAVDGWSMGVLAADLRTAYTARRDGHAPGWAPLPVQYADYALWQRELLGDPDDPASMVGEQLGYWREALAGLPEELALPADRSRAAVPSFDGGAVPVRLDAATHDGLVRVARDGSATVFMVLQAALAVLLSRAGAGTDIPIGTPVAGRGDPALENLAGFFVNTLVLRTDVGGDPAFTDVLARVRRTGLAAYAHQELPFERLVDELAPERTLARHPLFQVMLTLRNTPETEWMLPGLAVQAGDIDFEPARFDLSFTFTERRDDRGEPAGIAGELRYAADLFDESTAASLAARLTLVLEQVAADPRRRVSELEVLTQDERRCVLDGWQGAVPAAPAETLPGLFAAQVARTPAAVAVVDGNVVLTYAELDERANRVANWLLHRGVRPEDRVGVVLVRSADLVAVLLGVLKAGAAYVPVDPGHPAGRIARMLDDARVQVVLTDTAVDEVLAAESVGAPDVPASPESLAYVMFTSGSTGTPKGVAVTHANIVAFVLDRCWDSGMAERVLVQANHAFDASTYELWVPLVRGGCLVLLPPGTERAAVITEHQVTNVHATAGLFRVLAEESPEIFAGIREVSTGGDVVSASAIRALSAAYPDLVVRTTYGPTETTAFTTQLAFRAGDEVPDSVPLGQPMDGSRTFVLDEFLQPVPPGVTGELYVAGSGVARGYAGSPRPTAERFLACPFGNGRMYRTGDLARWNRDGQLLFAGRADEQVKIRGFRVEPAEVEAVLAGHPGVGQAAVVVREDAPGGKRLVGYVVPADGQVDPDTLRTDIAQVLPDYLVPSAILPLDTLPVTVNGKLDRAALPAPELDPEPGRAPATALEATLCELFSDILGHDGIGVDDSFFALGGDSIMSMLLVARARRAGVGLTARQVFERPTPAALAAVAEQVAGPDAGQGGGVGVVPLTPAMRELVAKAGEVALTGKFAQSTVVSTPSDVDEERLLGAVRALLAHHDVLRARYTDGQLVVPGPDDGVRAADCLRIGTADVPGELARAVGELRPDAGVLLRLVWWPDRRRLLIVAHHLVVDGVSWQILLPDLAEAYAGGELSGGTSWRHWAEVVAAQAVDAERVAELPSWTRVLDGRVTTVAERALDPAVDTEGRGMRRASATVPAPVATRLVTRISGDFHAGVTEILLAGLVAALAERGAPDGGLLVDVEGHGRVPLREEMDLSRTVGWFAGSHPVRLDPGPIDLAEVRRGGAEVGRLVKRIKEQVRDVPGDGLGYAMLRYLNPDTAPAFARLPVAEVGFNYLGRFAGAGGDWRPLGDSAFVTTTDPRAAATHALEAVALVREETDGPALTVSLTGPAGLWDEAALGQLAAGWTAMLTGLAGHEGGGHTPSDFPLLDLGQDDVDELEAAVPGLADVWPLSPLQEGMLFHSGHAGNGRDPYVEQISVELAGDLDVALLRTSWQALTDRHASLRAGFRQPAGLSRPVQVVEVEAVLPWREADLSRESTVDADRLMAAELARFDPTRPPLLRVLLIRLGDEEYRLVLTMHHIVLDGWSLPVLFDELSRIYAHGGDPACLAPPPSFGDYLAWLDRQDVPTAREAWRDELAGTTEPTLIGPPGASPEPGPPRKITVALDRAVTEGLRELTRSRGLTVNTLVQGLWAVLVGTQTGRSDVVFGVTVANRPADLAGAERALGLFMNTVPVRVRLRPDEPFLALLSGLQARQSALIAHQYLGLAEIQRAAGPGATFDTVLAYESYPRDPDGPLRFDGVRVGELDGEDTAHYPLLLGVIPGDELLLRFDYRPDVLDEAAARALAGRFTRFAAQLAADPGLRVADFALLDDAERRMVVDDWNATARPSPACSLAELIEAQAARTPDAPAVVGDGVTLTYAELDTRANRMAWWLREQGTGLQSRVGVVLPRSADLVVVLLGVAKAGAAYVPLDPAHPAERAKAMLADACVDLVVRELPADLDSRPGTPVGPRVPADCAAYVMFTSGSTGTPKGVAVTHANIVGFVLDRCWDTGTADRILVHANHAFDASTYELWVALVRGGCLVLAPVGEVDAVRWGRVIAEHRVTKMHVTAGLFRVLVEESPEFFAGVQEVCAGGDVVSASAIRTLLTAHPDVVVRATYGPTETTAFTTQLAFRSGDEVPDSVPLGHPMDNTRVYVLDEFLRPVPPGVTGELYVAGSGVARGYDGKAGLTAGWFVACPSGGRMYRTGDLAGWTVDGLLTFAGRADDQVKIRGFRVEPGEVEAALAGLEQVGQAAVVVREDEPGIKRLVGYVVPADGPVDTGALRTYLAGLLPDYLVPAAVVLVDSLPVTANGKLDRAALPAPGRAAASRAPATPREVVLCKAFAEVLGRDPVGADDSFFDLGGDSILSMLVVARARREGLSISTRQVFEERTPAALARVARAAAAAHQGSGTGTVPLTPVMRELAERSGEIALTGMFAQSKLVRVPAGLALDTLVDAVQAVLDHHDLLRARLELRELVVPPVGAGMTAGACVRRATSGDVAAEERGAARRLDPQAGVMLQAVWFDHGPDEAGRLLIVAHHLAVDGVSWRVLLPDLAGAYAAVARRRPAVLDPVGTSFRDWAVTLTERAAGRRAELPAWIRVLDGPGTALAGRALDPAVDTVDGGMCRASLCIPAATAGRLTTELPAAYYAGVDQVLLTGLVAALAQRNGGLSGGVLVDVEGHGREPLSEDMDLTRTVGWFTSTHPVRLDPGTADYADVRAGGPAAGGMLLRIKEQLAAVPGDGLGYGMLRYLDPESAPAFTGLPGAQLGFNYLGRFAAGTASGDWQPIDETVLGGATDGRVAFSHALEATALVRDLAGGPELTVTLTGPAGLFDEAALSALLADWAAMLDGLARCGGGGHSPSDFPLVALDQAEVSELDTAVGGLSDVWPLSPLQEGLFFLSGYDGQTGNAYIWQRILDIEGALDVAVLRASWQALLDRHAGLRASFRQLSGLGEAVQPISTRVAAPWREADLSHLSTVDMTVEAQRLAEEQRARFDLATPPLLRLLLIRLGDDRHRLVVTMHHLVLDGWSLPILFEELSEIYAAGGAAHALPPARSYRDYLAWLAAQDHEAAADAWRTALAGVGEGTLVAPGHTAAEPVRHLAGRADRRLADALRALAAAHGLTLSTIVQGAWGVLVGMLTGRTDVVFGATVATRPAELPGAERTPGLFINTVPVRVVLDPAWPFAELLAELQRQHTGLFDHQYLGLADIQRAAGEGAAFDTLTVYQNYPGAPSGRRELGGLPLTMVGGDDAAHYPLTLVTTPGDELELRLEYRPDVFAEPAVRALVDRLLRILARVAADPRVRVRDVDLLTRAEREQVAHTWNTTAAAPGTALVPDLFSRQVWRTPGAVAVVSVGARLS